MVSLTTKQVETLFDVLEEMDTKLKAVGIIGAEES